MKVTKLDIKRELLDMRDSRPSYDFVKVSPKASMLMDENIAACMDPSVEKLTYYVYKVILPISREQINYLIHIDNLGIVNDLFRISEDNLAAKIMVEREFAEKYGRHEAIQKIKKLPWWRRLLNKF